jgi:acetylornithine deacetylase/succinyl-diaminopimelate desuccinylase-like protein
MKADPILLPADTIALLQAMVSFDSVNSRISQRPAAERPLADYLAAVARAWGLKAQFLPIEAAQSNLLISAGDLTQGKPVLLLESHLDTVTVEGMTIPPFVPAIVEGRLSGRGSCDTKASGACMLRALATAYSRGTLANPTALLFTVDEEVGKLGIEKFAREQLPAMGWKPALALVGEPTLLAPVIAHNGAVRWKIRTRGIPAHSSDPSLGRSAISDMVHVIRELEGNYIPSLGATHPLTGKAQASINQISGGRQANVIPDCCEIVIDRRTVPGESLSEVLPVVEAHLEKLRAAVPGIRVDQYDAFFDPSLEPLEMEKTLEFLKPSLDAVGVQADPRGMACGTDAANLGAVGIPTVVIGPGDLRQAHTVDEWIAIEQVHLGEKFFLSVLESPL